MKNTLNIKCPLCKDNTFLIKNIDKKDNLTFNCPVKVTAPFPDSRIYGESIMDGKEYTPDSQYTQVSHFSFFYNPNKHYFTHGVILGNFYFKRSFVELNEHSKKLPQGFVGETTSVTFFYKESKHEASKARTFKVSNHYYPNWFEADEDLLEKKFNKIQMLS